MLKKVTAYQTPDGKLEINKERAVALQLQSLASAGWDFQLPVENAMQMVRKRKEIIALLQECDAPESSS